MLSTMLQQLGFPLVLLPGTDEPQIPTAAHHILTMRLSVCSVRAQGSFASWVGEGRREKLLPQPEQELVPEQGSVWQRKTRGACSHSLHPRSDTAFCCGFFADWHLQSLSTCETWHTEQLRKTKIHLHLSSAGSCEDLGDGWHPQDGCGDSLQ